MRLTTRMAVATGQSAELVRLKARLRRMLARLSAETGRPFEFIALDTTNNCNLRCPFCFNDFATVGPRTLTRQIFVARVLQLFPLVSGRVFFSCLFEPAIHPDFLDLLDMIPRKEQPKVFFTTNLALPLEDDFFRRLSRLRLAFINISVDSFNPATYRSLRRGGRLEHHLANLERLAATFANATTPPPLHVITMALKPNYTEIPRLVERCARDFGVVDHEIRYVYANSSTSAGWKHDNLLTPEEWLGLQTDCRGLPCTIYPPPAGYFTDDRAPYSMPAGESGREPADPVGLRISSDGRVELSPAGELYDLRSLVAPRRFLTTRAEAFRGRPTREPAS